LVGSAIDEPAAQPTWEITYYTLGEGVWKTTPNWSPAGCAVLLFILALAVLR
jgi:hypothetical protein